LKAATVARFHWTLDFLQHLEVASAVAELGGGGGGTACGVCQQAVRRAHDARVLMCAHVLCGSCAERAERDQKLPTAPSGPTGSSSSSSSVFSSGSGGRRCPLCAYAQPFVLSEAPLVSAGSALAERTEPASREAAEAVQADEDDRRGAARDAEGAAGEAEGLGSGCWPSDADAADAWRCAHCASANHAAAVGCCGECGTPNGRVGGDQGAFAPARFDFAAVGLCVGTQVARLVAGFGPVRGVVVACREDDGTPVCVVQDCTKAWLQPLDDDDDNDDDGDDNDDDDIDRPAKRRRCCSNNHSAAATAAPTSALPPPLLLVDAACRQPVFSDAAWAAAWQFSQQQPSSSRPAHCLDLGRNQMPPAAVAALPPGKAYGVGRAHAIVAWRRSGAAARDGNNVELVVEDNNSVNGLCVFM
jgi:hypothetical protein